MKRFVFISIFILGSIVHLQAQGFEAKAFTGFTLSQMEGDNLAGFDKAGLNSGVQVMFHITDKYLVGMELGYIQKGSRQGILDLKLFSTDVVTQLNYFELPVLFEIRDWYDEKIEGHRVAGHLGVSFAYLFSADSENELIMSYVDDFENELSFVAGGTIAITKRWYTTLRYQRAFTKMYKDTSLNTDGLLNYLWSIRMEFKF